MRDHGARPGGDPSRYRPGGRHRWIGPRPRETSAAFQVVPTAVALALAFVLLAWYGVLQRQVRVTAALDRFEAILAGGAVPPGRSVVEAACLEVQRIEGDVLPLAVAADAAGDGIVASALDLADGMTGVPLRPWLSAGRVRAAVRDVCVGARHAARAWAAGAEGSASDLDAARASYARGLDALASVDARALASAAGLARAGLHLGEARAAVAAHGLDAPSLVALTLAAGPTVAGEGRGALWLVVARAHAPGGAPDAVAIARVSVRDGAVVAVQVDTAAGWEARTQAFAPAPTGLARQAPSPGWHLADFDWWLDFRRAALQLLALWGGAAHDAAAIDGVVAIDAAVIGGAGGTVGGGMDAAAVARHLEEALGAARGSRAGTGALLASLAAAARDGMAVAWARDPAVQAVVEARGWAGVPEALPPDGAGVVRRAARGARAWRIEAVGPASAGVRVTGSGSARVVVAASVPVRAVAGASGPVEATREGDLTVLDVTSVEDGAEIRPVG